MSVAQVLAELGVHDLHGREVLATERTGPGSFDYRIVPAWTEWRCRCGFRADLDHAIPEAMVRNWHDKAML